MTFRQLMINNDVKVLNDDYVNWRGCKRKRRYKSFADANAAAERSGHGKAYACLSDQCFGFHVGHDERTTISRSK